MATKYLTLNMQELHVTSFKKPTQHTYQYSSELSWTELVFFFVCVRTFLFVHVVGLLAPFVVDLYLALDWFH